MTDDTPGSRLRSARRAAGLSTEQLGERAAQIADRPKPISSSAIRNQENGTNGIPWALLVAYARVLGINSQWLLFGEPFERYGEPVSQHPHLVDESPGEPDPLESVEIDVQGPITAEWDELTPLSQDDREGEYGHFLHIDVTGYWDVKLEAHLVADNSLAPTYPKGTYLICAPVYRTGVRDGDHVILWSVDDQKAVRRTIREARKLRGVRGGAAELVPIGNNNHPRLPWFSPGIVSRIYPEATVVATYRPITAESRGRPIALPETLQDSEAARAAGDMAAATAEPGDEKRGDDLLARWRFNETED